MSTMYTAIPNSPSTTISIGINDSQTTVELVDTSDLLPAPNLLTFGVNIDAETIRYTNIDNNTITIERGFEGVAKSWNSGTEVARLFTAYDHNTFIDRIQNIGTPESEVFNNVEKYVDENYTYFVADTLSGWKCNRWDILAVKMSISGVSNKPTSLSDCQILVFS